MASIEPKYGLFYSRLYFIYGILILIILFVCMNGSARARPKKNQNIYTLRFFLLTVDSFNTPKVSILCLRFF